MFTLSRFKTRSRRVARRHPGISTDLSVLAVSILLGLVAVATAAPVIAAGQYQEIELPWPTGAELLIIRSLPDLEPMKVDAGRTVRYLSTPELTGRLIDAGLSPTVIVDDLEAFYTERAVEQRSMTNFGLLYTYSETVAELDLIHATYPDLTTARMQIGTSLEGNPIWAMKISDNPNVQEDEPEVLLDALHHAREGIGTSVLLDFMHWLCENHGSDPEATFLVDSRQIWFVPIVNPDGYLYNESTNPAGGGMWRKNRRVNAGGCIGVDLNRNWGYQWGGAGSSSNPCDDTYHGTAAFSEPETRALRDLMLDHEFVTHDSYHSVIGTILYPWGWTSSVTPDHALFQVIADERVRDSGYDHYTGYGLYVTSGNCFDWSYGEQTLKPKTIAFTTEVGGSGFWPLDSEIPGLVAENLYSNIYLSLVAGAYVALQDLAVEGGNGNGRLDPGETAQLVATVQNVGVLASAANVALTLSSNDAYVQLVSAQAGVGSLGAGASGSNMLDPFTVSVDPATPDGHQIVFEVRASWADGQSVGQSVDQATLTVGQPTIILTDDFESGPGGWTQDPSHTASTGAWVLVDPNPTDFQPGDDTTPPPGVNCWITGQNISVGEDDVDNGRSAMRSPTWDLSAYESVRIRLRYFHGQRDPGDDPGGDYFRIAISSDGGATFPANVVDIGDVYHAENWLTLDFNVEDYVPISNQVVLRFQASDGVTAGDIIEGGIDDLEIINNGSGNQPPTAPRLLLPIDGSAGHPGNLMLRVFNATDPEGDPLTYGFHVYADELLTSPVRTVTGVVQGSFITEWVVDPPLADGTYWWRTYAEDPEGRGPFMTAASFTVGVAIGVPGAGSDDGGAPAEFAVEPLSPNPFTTRTGVRFSLPTEGQVRVGVFDVGGRRVRSLYRGVLPAGQQSLVWDGRDQRGQRVPGGEYFVQVLLDGRVLTRKVLVLE